MGWLEPGPWKVKLRAAGWASEARRALEQVPDLWLGRWGLLARWWLWLEAPWVP